MWIKIFECTANLKSKITIQCVCIIQREGIIQLSSTSACNGRMDGIMILKSIMKSYLCINLLYRQKVSDLTQLFGIVNIIKLNKWYYHYTDIKDFIYRYKDVKDFILH